MSNENQIHDAEEEEEIRPLIDSSILTVDENEEDKIDRSSFSVPTNQRLVSLDVFRGLTVAVRLLFITLNSIASFLLIN